MPEEVARPRMVRRRPAESATLVVGAVAFLLGRAFGWDGDVQGAVTIVVGAVPAGITWLVETLRGRSGG